MSVTVRPFQERDYPAIVQVFNACEPDTPWSEADSRERDQTWDYSKYVRLRHVAEIDDEVVGYGQISHNVYGYHPGKFSIHAMVHPDHRRRGAGSALYQELLQELTARDALLARCDLPISRTETIDFIAKRGFVEVSRYWESRLDLATFDDAPFARAAPRLAQQGIVLRTVAEERQRTPDYAPRVYAIHMTQAGDEPSLDARTMPEFEHWRVRNVDSPFLLASASHLAIDPRTDGAYVGMSFLYRTADPEILKQSFTGVQPGYRRRGIAMAVKLAGIRAARAAGFREIRTESDSLNRPMLRINEALGFQKQPPFLTFEKRLQAAS